MFVGKSFEVRSLDKIAIEDYGLPGLILMENAARSILQEAINFWPELNSPQRVAILIGPGQNGGDGWVLARLLQNLGHDVRAFFAAKKNYLPQGDALINYQIALKLKVPVTRIHSASQVAKISLAHYDLLIDALFGTGLDRPLTEPFHQLLTKAAQAKRNFKLKTLAVDLPSFLSGDSGNIFGPTFPIDLTVTLAVPKVGLYLGAAPDFCCEIRVGDIGLCPPMLAKQKLCGQLLDKELAQKLLPPRPQGGHKGTFGHALLVGGSKGFSGALILAALGASRSGTGLVTALCPLSLQNALAAQMTETMTHGLAENANEPGFFSINSASQLLSVMENKKALGLGPGLGLNDEAKNFVWQIAENSFLPTVFDADALSALAGHLKILKKNKQAKILTPHPGEAARLLGCNIAQIEEDRLSAAQTLAQASGAVIILKGRHTIIASPTGQYFINTTGGPYMAVGGTGDLLTGLCTGLLAQGQDPVNAALLAVWVHGRAADLAAEKIGPFGLRPQDFAQMIPTVWQELSCP